MRVTINVIFAIFLTITIFSDTPVEGTNLAEPDGKLLVQLNVAGGHYEVVSLKVVPGVIPVETDFGEESYRLLDRNGNLLNEGRFHLQKFIIHEYADENGDFHGTAEPFEGLTTITIPYFKSAGSLEIRARDRIITRNLDNVRTLKRSLPKASPTMSAPPDFRGYMQELEQQHLDALKSEVQAGPPSAHPPGKKTILNGTVKVTGVDNYGLVRAEISFYPRGSEFWPVKTTSDDKGGFSVKLDKGNYLVKASCYYRDPALNYREVLLYPNPIFIADVRHKTKKLEFKWDLNHLFHGYLAVKGKGRIEGDIHIMDNELARSTYQRRFVTKLTTDSNGNFAIRLPAEKFAMVVIPNPQAPAGDTVKVVDIPTNGKPVKLLCPRARGVSSAPLKKIWDSGADEKNLTLVFLSECYTDIVEPFTDLNGNGQWDGDLLLDYDGDGMWDNYQFLIEYYYDRNHNGLFDEPEPFVDLNGDGICNRHERAQFEASSAMNAAAMLNFEPFDEFTDRVNIYTYWVPSTHAMMKLTRVDKWKEMESAFGTYCTYIFNRQAARVDTDLKDYASKIIPTSKEFVPVLLIHDPMNIVRGYTKFDFGPIVMSGEDHRAGGVLIHELGHSVGSLDDEYLYFMDHYEGEESPYVNSTIETDPSKVKWKKYFDRTPPVPTPYGFDGYGLFEGAVWATGIYRPTYMSMMRNTYYPFFDVNSDQLRKVMRQFGK